MLIRTTNQLVDIFTKPLRRHMILPIMSMMALKTIFQSLSRGGILELHNTYFVNQS